MQPIITITFNPAIDKSTTIPLLVAEKKMYCSEPVYEPGGGGVNVARVIKKLGGDAIAVYMAGGHSGKKFNQLLAEEAVTSVVTEIKENTRENLVVSETGTNRQYRFVMPGPTIAEAEWMNCLNSIEKLADVPFIVASGSLPAGMPADIFARLAAIAHRKKAKLVVDTSGKPLEDAIKAGAYLIKPSTKELAALIKREHMEIQDVIDAAKEVINMGGCEVMVVSMGGDGAILVTKDVVLKAKPPTVDVKGTVGAGDSMVAGLVLSLARNGTLEKALQYGVACGTAATMNPGTGLCNKDDVERLYKMLVRQNALA
ncbi:1-phosphofructokinase [Mucilaginibacter sp.]|jgi:6-phosphofructokinase 2|uniref:1-phosphofructokinase n=1 Tax=Mucilaginibacter sp. TaxID=1882438 RepID=UPI002BE227CE|nr:1-phosphofructokinase [Mucilaginibacter sp.]HTI58834.1 1-phosphofructokinase [Mucilaginibacter sp.]